MNIVIDESVSYSLANVLRDAGHTVQNIRLNIIQENL